MGDGAPAGDFAGLVAVRQDRQLAQALDSLRRMMGTRGAQAYCLDCPVAAAPLAPAGEQLGWLARIAGLLGV